MFQKQIVSDQQTSQCLNHFAFCPVYNPRLSQHPLFRNLFPSLCSFCSALSLFCIVIIHLYQDLTLHLSPKSLTAGSPSLSYAKATSCRSCTAAASHHIPEAPGKETIALVTGKTLKVWSLCCIVWHLDESLRSGSTSSILWKLVRDAHYPGSVSPTHTDTRYRMRYCSQVLELWQSPLGCPQGCYWSSSLPFPIPYVFFLCV